MRATTFLIAALLVTVSAYSQAPNTWTQKANFGGGTRGYAVGFVIDGKGYISTGDNFAGHDDCWEYNPTTNAWTQKANYGGGLTSSGEGFSIGSKGYLLGGGKTDFWEFDPVANLWIQKANFPGAVRIWGVGFSIDSKGYIGTGSNYINNNWVNYKDFYEYDPAADTWAQKADFGGLERTNAAGFSIGNKGYLGTGQNGGSLKKDFYEYDPSTNTWIQKADFAGVARQYATGLSIGNKGYIGTGNASGGFLKDFYEYDPVSDTWTEKADFGGTGRYYATSFSIGTKGYLGTGYTSSSFVSDFWEYTPEISSCAIPANLSSTSITGSTAKLTWHATNSTIFYKVSFKKTGTSEWTTIKTISTSKTLHELSPNTEYAWKVKSVCGLNPNVASDWSEKLFFSTAPQKLANVSEQQSITAYPNPLVSSTSISFYLKEVSTVVIRLLDVNGRTVSEIANGNYPAGNQEITFVRGLLAAGIYFLQMKTGEGVMMKKLVVE